jgi:hypothetical protein
MTSVGAGEQGCAASADAHACLGDDLATCDIIYDELPPGPPGRSDAPPVSPSAPSAPLVPVLVKPLRSHTRADEAPEDTEVKTVVVHMSLLKDLEHRLDKRVLSAEELSRLAPEMADDGSGSCRPQCLVCLEELEAGQAMSRLACGHTFHHACMCTWLVSQLESKHVGACPHCKHAVVVPVITCVEEQGGAVAPARAPGPRETPRRSRRPGCFSVSYFSRLLASHTRAGSSVVAS